MTDELHPIPPPAGYRLVDPDDVLAYQISGPVLDPEAAASYAADSYAYEGVERDPNDALRVLIASVDDQTPRWVPFYEAFRAETLGDLRCDELDRRDAAHYYGQPYEPALYRLGL